MAVVPAGTPSPSELQTVLLSACPPSNHSHRFKTYQLTVTGAALTDAIASQSFCASRETAVSVGQSLIDSLRLHHVLYEHGFEDSPGLFYRWTVHDKDVTLNSTEASAKQYDIIVIGAGSGGLTAASFAAKLGARVALVDRHTTGGDCTWTGCVPSKALIKASKVASYARKGDRFGTVVAEGGVKVDMDKVRQYVAGVVQEVWQHETPDKVREEGTHMYVGAAQFETAHTLRITETQTTDGSFGGALKRSGESKADDDGGDGAVETKTGEGGTDTDSERQSITLSAHKFLICTGARPALPPTPGLDSVPFITYETVFDVDTLPDRLAVMGTGPIGCELAQAYAKFGSKVTMIGRSLLGKEEDGVREAIKAVFESDGITHVSGRPTEVKPTDPTGGVSVSVGSVVVEADLLLVATGRQPNLDLNLEAAGVVYTATGITVDAKLRTNVQHIYAAGDVTGGPQFTHYAGWQAFNACRNALLPGSSPGHSELVPWCTYTSPEVAHVGLTAEQAVKTHGDAVTVLKLANSRNDRSVCDSDTVGYSSVSVLSDGTIVGATVVSERAGEVISEIVLAMRHNLKLADVAAAIHPYPTYSTAVWHSTSDEVIRRFLSSTTAKFLTRKYRG